MRTLLAACSFIAATLVVIAAVFCVLALPAAVARKPQEPEDFWLLTILIAISVLAIVTMVTNGLILAHITAVQSLQRHTIHVLNLSCLGLIALLGVAVIVGNAGSSVETVILLIPGFVIAFGYWQVLKQ